MIVRTKGPGPATKGWFDRLVGRAATPNASDVAPGAPGTPGIPPGPPVAGTGGLVLFRRSFQWLVSAFGLQSPQLPNVLDVSAVRLVTEINQPIFRGLSAPDPAVGTNYAAPVNWTVPQGTMWELVCWQALFTASAVVGNRQVAIQWVTPSTKGTFGAGATYQFGAQFNIVASKANLVVFAPCAVSGQTFIGGTGPDVVSIAAPIAVRWPAGTVINTIVGGTLGIDAGDQWSQGVLTVREWVA